MMSSLALVSLVIIECSRPCLSHCASAPTAETDDLLYPCLPRPWSDKESSYYKAAAEAERQSSSRDRRGGSASRASGGGGAGAGGVTSGSSSKANKALADRRLSR